MGIHYLRIELRYGYGVLGIFIRNTWKYDYDGMIRQSTCSKLPTFLRPSKMGSNFTKYEDLDKKHFLDQDVSD